MSNMLRWQGKNTGFELIHPGLQLTYFAVVLVLTMTAMQPVLLTISFISALLFSFCVRGWQTTLKTLVILLPLVIICAVINPLFAMMGSSEVVRFGQHAIYLESIIFGLCMGMMLASVILWFSCASKILSTDKVLAVLGGVLPVVGLMISMAMRLVPQFTERGKLIGSVAESVTSARPLTKRDHITSRLRIVSVLMGWSLEESLQSADAMKARGWGATNKRTGYKRYRFAAFDLFASLALALLVITCSVLAFVACSQFHFYPTMSTLTLWWGYIPYALLMLLPLVVRIVEDLRFKWLGQA